MSGAIIRDVTNVDVPAVTAIYGWSVENETGSFEFEAPDENEMRRRILSIIKDKYPYLVVEVDGVVCGYAYASPFRPLPAYNHTVETSIYIEEGFHGKGLGKQLLGELIKRCEIRQYRQLVAVIGDAENSASIALHKSFGFEKVGILSNVGRKHDKWLDVVMMQKSLGAGG